MRVQNDSGNISLTPRHFFKKSLIECKEFLLTHCNVPRPWQLRIWLHNNIKFSFIIPRQDTLLVITSQIVRPIICFHC